MKLADERRSRRFREPDPLEFRVFLFIAGAAFLALTILALQSESREVPIWAIAVIAAFVLLGSCLLLISVFGSRSLVEKWSEAVGNHEVSIAIYLVALPVAWIIRKWIRGSSD